MKNTFKLGLLLIGALALSLTLATAEGKCGDAQKGMMSNEDSQKGMMNNEDSQKGMMSNEDSQKGMMNNEGKCDGAKKEKKEAPAKGKCGQGKCG